MLTALEKLKDPKANLLSVDTAFDTFLFPAILEAYPDLKAYVTDLEKSAPTKEEAKAKVKAFMDEKKKELMPFIKENLDIMSNEFSYINANTPRLTEAISTVIVISTAAVATVAATVPLLPAGPAAAAAQLAQYIPDIKQKVSNLHQISDSLKVSANKLASAANKIYFPLPPVVSAYISTISGFDALISAIPIPA
jgi:hypothetical protein